MFDTEHRTNNFVESHNKHLKEAIPNRTNFYRFAEALVIVECKTAHDLLQVLEGLPVGKQRTKQCNAAAAKELNIKTAKQLYGDGKISLAAYVRRLAGRFANIIGQNNANFDERDLPMTTDAADMDEDDIGIEDDDDGMCKICKVMPQNCAFVPCGHYCGCEMCSEDLVACPTCSKPGKMLRIIK